MPNIDPARVRKLNDVPMREKARYVLYWSQMNRRTTSNHALVYAAKMANDLGLPLLFYEGLTCSYMYANDRLHTFVMEGVPTTEILGNGAKQGKNDFGNIGYGGPAPPKGKPHRYFFKTTVPMTGTKLSVRNGELSMPPTTTVASGA